MKWSTIRCDIQMLSHVLCMCVCVLLLTTLFTPSLPCLRFFINRMKPMIMYGIVYGCPCGSGCVDVLMSLCPVWIILCTNWCMDTHHLVHFSFPLLIFYPLSLSLSLSSLSRFSSKKLQLQARKSKNRKMSSSLQKRMRDTRWFNCVTSLRWILPEPKMDILCHLSSFMLTNCKLLTYVSFTTLMVTVCLCEWS